MQNIVHKYYLLFFDKYGALTSKKIVAIINLLSLPRRGEVSEGFKELVLKTSDTARYRGFESHLLRQFFRSGCRARKQHKIF